MIELLKYIVHVVDVEEYLRVWYSRERYGGECEYWSQKCESMGIAGVMITWTSGANILTLRIPSTITNIRHYKWSLADSIRITNIRYYKWSLADSIRITNICHYKWWLEKNLPLAASRGDLYLLARLDMLWHVLTGVTPGHESRRWAPLCTSWHAETCFDRSCLLTSHPPKKISAYWSN